MSTMTVTFPYNSLKLLTQDLSLKSPDLLFNILSDDSMTLYGLEHAQQQATQGGRTEHSSLKFYCFLSSIAQYHIISTHTVNSYSQSTLKLHLHSCYKAKGQKTSLLLG